MSETVTAPDILEDLKSGRLVVVPREADLADYDAGLLNDWGGGDVDWWQDYLRAEIGRANDFWRSQIASPDHTAGLIALVEGMEAKVRESAMQSLADGYQAEEAYAAQKAAEARALAAKAERDEADAEITSTESLLADERRMRFAAEAERDALREALAGAIAAFPHIRDEQTQKALDVLRALTEQNNG